MSETEHKVGTLVDTGKFFMDYLSDKDIPDYYDDEMEYFNDMCNAVIYEGTVWEIDSNDVNQEEDIFEAERVSDVVITFETKYYNGGCGEKEAIEYALEKLSK